MIHKRQMKQKEHNTNLAKAKEVARDHIGERPDYYKMLKKAEKSSTNPKDDVLIHTYKGIVELNLTNEIDDFSVSKLDAKARTVTVKAEIGRAHV